MLLLLGDAGGFFGYLLPWDETAYWATVVGINLPGPRCSWAAPGALGSCRAGRSSARTRYRRSSMLHIPGAIIALIGFTHLVVRSASRGLAKWSNRVPAFANGAGVHSATAQACISRRRATGSESA